MTLNNLILRFCNAEALRNVEYPFIAIVPKSPLAGVVVLYMDQIELNCELEINWIA